MDILTIRHPAFKLSLSCEKFPAIREKALLHIKESAHLSCSYLWDDNAAEVQVYSSELGALQTVTKDNPAEAIFFDNTDYDYLLTFTSSEVQNAEVAIHGADKENSNPEECKARCHFFRNKQIVSGYLNYGNEIGRSKFTIEYTLSDGKRENFTFYYNVLSTKLDYYTHWRTIVTDIEKDYRLLVLDFMRHTYHSFRMFEKEMPKDLVWWTVYNQIHQQFISVCQKIIDRPHHCLHREDDYLRLDQLRNYSPAIENEILEHRKEPRRTYFSTQYSNSRNTLENRFLKYVVKWVAEKYHSLHLSLRPHYPSSATSLADFAKIDRTLLRLSHHPFFRTIGKFKGFHQESLVLQRAEGYSQVYHLWIMLRKSYEFAEGLFNLETKDIATLYELWCFIQVKNIVGNTFGVKPIYNHEPLIRKNHIYVLGKGEAYKPIFKDGDIELGAIIYNSSFTEKSGTVVSRTVEQKPDIVLQLRKQDVSLGYLTYLFDAKYRIDRESNGVDYPPEDAINVMHRYRDAIYYDLGDNQLNKEVIGGYILFPGTGDKNAMKAADFYRSIKCVNIGAFPLRPNDAENRTLLEDFINGLIKKENGKDIIMKSAIPQKGLYYS